MHIHMFQHVPFEGLAGIADWVALNHHPVTVTRFYQREPIPNINAIDWLIVMGGPMSTYDEAQYPWLVEEKRFIEQAIKHKKVVLGICLGAQLVAEVLGARVYANQHKEIGWFPITLTEAGQESPLFRFLPPRFNVFHWHGDTFDLPDSAVHIASSEGCTHQAFVYGARVVGLQFHLEMTPRNIRDIVHHCANELGTGPYIQSPDEMLSHPDDVAFTNNAMHELLTRLQRG
jgi:GMP synthase-like glutamine amidotransferase